MNLTSLIRPIFLIVSVLFVFSLVWDIRTNSELYITTPCDKTGDEVEPFDISVLTGVDEFGNEVEVFEEDRLRHSCRAWMHNRNILYNNVIPYLLFTLFIMSMNNFGIGRLKRVWKRAQDAQKETER